jgi:hypothetical protein
MKLLIMQFSPVSCPSLVQIFPQHPVLKRRPSVRPSVLFLENNNQNLETAQRSDHVETKMQKCPPRGWKAAELRW